MNSRFIAALILFLASLFACELHAECIIPAPFHPGKNPGFVGPYAPNDRLAFAQQLGKGQLDAPEEVAVDSLGRVYTGTADGYIKRILTNGDVEIFATTGGRPLGLDFDAEGNLWAVDAEVGLLKITPDQKIEVVTDAFEGKKLHLLDDVKVAHDGRVYFTEASTKYGLDDYAYDFLEGRPYGRLFRYDPATGRTELLMKDLYFANGIALSEAEDFLIVAETSRYRLTRYWIDGPKAGSHEIWLDNLPALPDTLASSHKGTIWVAFSQIRSMETDELQPHPIIKGIASLLPKDLWAKLIPYGFVAAYSESGEVLQTLQDPSGKTMTNVSSIEEFDGKIYMGTINGTWIGVVPVD